MLISSVSKFPVFLVHQAPQLLGQTAPSLCLQLCRLLLLLVPPVAVLLPSELSHLLILPSPNLVSILLIILLLTTIIFIFNVINIGFKTIILLFLDCALDLH